MAYMKMSLDEEKGEEEEEDDVHQWKGTLGRRRNGNYGESGDLSARVPI
jgi:hypothetical protein